MLLAGFADLRAMVCLSGDGEPTVRSDLVERFSHVEIHCQENRNSFPNVVATYILPLVMKYLGDNDNQIRKTGYAALIVLLQQKLVERLNVEDQVVQVLLDLADPGSPDEFHPCINVQNDTLTWPGDDRMSISCSFNSNVSYQ